MEPVMQRSDAPRLILDDNLKIEVIVHPYSFEHSPDKELNQRIVDAINQMGGIGESGEKCYQSALDGLARRAKDVIRIAAAEYARLPKNQYLDRWALVQLIAEIKDEVSLEFLDRILSSEIPPEESNDPHSFTTVGEEVMIRTTGVDAVAGIAADGSAKALEVLLRHVRHDNFSVKRASIQGYLAHGGADAAEQLKKILPERDHYILDIKRIDVRQAPQAEGGLHLVCRDKGELPPHDPAEHQDGKPAGGNADDSCKHC